MSKRFTLLTITLLSLGFLNLTFSQTNNLDGAWYSPSPDGNWEVFSKVNDSVSILKGFFISGNEIAPVLLNTETNEQYDIIAYHNFGLGLDYEVIKVQNGNTATYTSVSTCEECGWTETHFWNLSLVSSDLITGHWYRIVNNHSGDDCFDEDGNCFTMEKQMNFIRVPQ